MKIMLPLPEKRFTNGVEIPISEYESPLSLERFIVRYEDDKRNNTYTDHSLREPHVFVDVEEFQEFLLREMGAYGTRYRSAWHPDGPDGLIIFKGPLVHKSCIDDYGSLCIHYVNTKGIPSAMALYGYTRTDGFA